MLPQPADAWMSGSSARPPSTSPRRASARPWATEALLPGRDHFAILDVARQIALQHPGHVLEGQLCASRPGLDIVADIVRRQDQPIRIALEQRVAHIDWLLLEHVERGAGDGAVVDRVSQRRL